MAFIAGQRVLSARPVSSVGQGLLAYPFRNFRFGTVRSVSGSSITVLWDNGHQNVVPAAALDNVSSEEVTPRVVRPVGESTPEYDAVVVGEYPRISDGDGTNKGTFLLVRTLSSADSFFEALVSEFVEVEGR
jgi:hypothetical protein